MRRWQQWAQQFSSLMGLMLICVALSIATHWKSGENLFLTRDNLLTLLRQVSFNAIMAAGVSVVIITAGIDLSIGSVWAFSSVVMAHLCVNADWSWQRATMAGLGVGLCAGWSMAWA